jgi:hypothetical protein
MAYYRVYLLNAEDVIFDSVGIERNTDAAAMAAAAALARVFAVEVWAGRRKVARLSADEVESQRATRGRQLADKFRLRVVARRRTLSGCCKAIVPP